MSDEAKKLLQRQLRHAGIDPESRDMDKAAFLEFVAKVEAQYQKYQTKIHSIESLTDDAAQEAKAIQEPVKSNPSSPEAALEDTELTLEQSNFAKNLHKFLGISRQHFSSDNEYMKASTTGILILVFVPAWAFYVLFYLMAGNLPALLSSTLGLLSAIVSLILIKWKGRYRLGYSIAHIFGGITLYFCSMFTGGIYSPIYAWLLFAIVASFLCGGSRLGSIVTVLTGFICILAYFTSEFFLTIKVPDLFSIGTHEFPMFVVFTYLSSLASLGIVTEIFHSRQRRAFTKIQLYSEKLKTQSTTLASQKKTLEDQKIQMIKQQNKLLDANRKLEELDKQKTHFFQMVSHELRTPLTLIIHPVETLKADFPDNESIEICSRNSKRLLRLVNQLLDFQKVRSKSLDLSVQGISVDYFVPSICQSFKPLCVEKGIKLNLKIEEKGVYIRGQVDALEKILFNLLSNAWKHTPSGGMITLEVSRMVNDVIRIGLKDTGAGITREQQKNLFKVFSQLESTTNRTYNGSGLGLALCKELVEAMNGQIGLESKPGEGSLFWIEIPEMNADEAKQASSDGAEIASSHEKIIADVRQTAIETLPILDSQPAIKSEGPYVVIVDDIADMRHIIARKLQGWGYRTREFEDSAQALDYFKKERVDLVITDWMMPGLSGPELVRALRQHPLNSVTPVVMLTSKADEKSKIEGVEFGANAYLGKPFDDLELKSTVENLIVLKSKEAQIENLNRNLLQNVLTRFMPPCMIADVVAGKKVFDETPKLRSITVLFCDLHEFTQKSNDIGAKQTATVLNRYFTEMSRVIFDNSGLVDKYIGDGIMALFGAFDDAGPVEQAGKSVQCAIDMQAALESLNLEFEKIGIPKFRMRIGINSGPAVVGSFGSESRSEYTAIGPAVNLASRIESVAEPDDILISATLRDYLAGEKWEHAGEYALKGVAGKMSLFRVGKLVKQAIKVAS